MNPKDIDLETLPKPVQEMLVKMDPVALKSLLDSLSGEDLKPMLAEAMGYVSKMPSEEKEAYKKMLENFFQDNNL